MHRAPGQTIMEVLLAFTVISVGLFSAMTLVYSNVSLVERDTEGVVAVNLAREAIELAKHRRVSNWLAGNAFDDGMFDGTDYTATPVWDGVQPEPFFTFAANDLVHGNAQVVRSQHPLAIGVFANQSVAPPVGGWSTPFSRLITFHPICDDQLILQSGSTCQDFGKEKIGIRLRVEVAWKQNNQLKTLTLYNDLYDWR